MKSIEQLKVMKSILSEPKLIDQFFQFILWNVNVLLGCKDDECMDQVMKLGVQYYQQNSQRFSQILSLKELIDSIVSGWSTACHLDLQRGRDPVQVLRVTHRTLLRRAEQRHRRRQAEQVGQAHEQGLPTAQPVLRYQRQLGQLRPILPLQAHPLPADPDLQNPEGQSCHPYSFSHSW